MFKKLGLIAACGLMAAALLGAPAHATDLSLDGNLRLQCGTGTASAGAVTLANKCGTITSEALTTAKDSDYTLTITNSVATGTDLVFAAVDNGTNTAGEPVVTRVTPGSGSIVILVNNRSSGSPLNGTLKIRFMLIKP